MKIKTSSHSLLVKLSKKENTIDWEEVRLNTSLDHLKQVEVLASQDLKIDHFPLNPACLLNVSFAALNFSLQNDLSEFSLQRLKISGTQMEQLPDINLAALTELYLPRNKLKTLTSFESLNQIRPLRELDLGQNKLDQLKIDFNFLPQLKRLNLENNNLSELPPSLFHLKELTHLALKGNPLTKECQQNLYDHFKIIVEN